MGCRKAWPGVELIVVSSTPVNWLFAVLNHQNLILFKRSYRDIWDVAMGKKEERIYGDCLLSQCEIYGEFLGTTRLS